MGTSIITVEAARLLSFLQILKLTTLSKDDGAGYAGILLRSVRADIGDTPGRSNTLVGISSDGVIAGQYVIPIDNSFSGKIVLPGPDIGLISELLATAKRTAPKNAEVLSQITVADSTMSMRILIDGVPRDNDREQTVQLGDSKKYPYDEVRETLRASDARDEVEDKETGQPLPQGNLTDLPLKYLSMSLSVAKAVGANSLRVYRVKHACSTVLVQADTWRGAFPGSVYPFGTDVDEPDVEVFD